MFFALNIMCYICIEYSKDCYSEEFNLNMTL